MSAVSSLTPDLAARRERLLEVLRDCGSVAVAFSGGIDSTVVAQAAQLALGAGAVAVTADSPSVPRAEIEDARRLAQQIGIRHVLVATDEFADADYIRNDGSRCYFCKTELYDQIEGRLPELGVRVDLQRRQPRRPGRLSARPEGGCGTRGPASAAGGRLHESRRARPGPRLGPADVGQAGVAVSVEPSGPRRRRLAQNAPAASRRPSFTCAASACAECRVRLHEGELARIEVPLSEVPRLAAPEVRDGLVRRLRELGFQFVTLDLEGFRSGSLNTLVSLENKRLFSLPVNPS